jgi:hypothetical protein
VLVLLWPHHPGGLRPTSAASPGRDWDEHLLSELGDLRNKAAELRAQNAELRGEVLKLRLQTARLHETVDARLPPPPEPELSPPATAAALLLGDLLPGPPRPLPGSVLPVLGLTADLARPARPAPVPLPADRD